jgi:sterol desaturase/sphingolipid hydroxylase (fatty acid hydroxylase superfamily)
VVDVILLAIPFFFLSIGVEFAIGLVKRRRIFRGGDVVADLSLAVMQTLFGIVGGVLLVGGYEYIYEHWRIATLGDSPLAYLGIFVGVDFFYYWFHRSAHRVNVFWASHAPHHSSEDFNFAVALRQGPLQPFFSHLFYLPLALVGFSPEMFVFSGSVNTVYQFFIHTELVRKLGPLEWIFNTPSHHRVHHGCNGRYIDRNHAGILIIWDRMFGTFEPEGDRPVYGTVKQVTTYNPAAIAVAPFADIARNVSQARLVDKIKIWFMPPEWLPPGMTAPVVDVVTREKFRAQPHAGTYVAAMFTLTLAMVVTFLVVGASKMSTGELWAATLWFTFSFTSLGALLDGRRWARFSEVARIVAAVPFVFELATHASA